MGLEIPKPLIKRGTVSITIFQHVTSGSFAGKMARHLHPKRSQGNPKEIVENIMENYLLVSF